MLHSLPSLLDELERRLIQGEEPMALLGRIQWADIIDWPRTLEEAARLKYRLADIQALISGLQAPLRATLMGLNQNATYKPSGTMDGFASMSARIHGQV